MKCIRFNRIWKVQIDFLIQNEPEELAHQRMPWFQTAGELP